ncbi:MAG: asparagine synthase (glutamine-hydrolyzing) [Alphaproteobacteria bacterium]|nr:asparagine synthase (glutamine-hydrolyzing) [Alphaproteobacteria bacterium]
MCGIAGFVGPGGLADLRRMMSALEHRGPDGAGTYHDPNASVFLGHRRLAIIDPGGGAQPMWNAEGSIGVVFNGEIYNHVELRRKLERRGHQFRTDHSDTEVLIHGYAEWGESLPEKLNGMFAFCIYDRTRARLFLARDRFGEKPLFYSQQGGLFSFASELTSIAQHSHFSSQIRRRSLQKLLAYGFLPAPNAILENCEKLPGGSWLTVDVRSGAIHAHRYWQFRLEPEHGWRDRPESTLVEELRELLFEAVRRRMNADVPLGLFLSGGIDSSAVLAAATKFRAAEDLQSFTLGFTEASFDESRPARRVADAFGVRNSIDWLELETARQQAPDILSRLDEPSCDPSVLPTHLLSRFTRQSVTVALSGDGGDELFAGYDPFSALAPARIYNAFVPRPLHSILRAATNRLPVSTRNMSLDFKLRRTLAGLSYPPELWNPVWLAPVDPEFMRDLFEEPLTPEELYSEALDVWSANGEQALIDRSLEFYTNFYLQDGILTKVDRATMLASLESRAVFLDNDLVDFCRRLPHRFKMRSGKRKYLLKKALEGLLPQDIIGRAKKGFGIPTASWLKSMPTNPPLDPVPGVRMDRVASAWSDHRNGSADNRMFLWSWLSVQSFGRLTRDYATPAATAPPSLLPVSAGSVG